MTTLLGGHGVHDANGFVEIDLDRLEFTEHYANTLIKWGIVAFFGENPNVRDTSGSIAGRLARDEAAGQRELDDLVLLGLLRRRGAGRHAVYWLTDEPDLRRSLSAFVAHSASRNSAIRGLVVLPPNR